jgi:hypothetical protein
MRSTVRLFARRRLAAQSGSSLPSKPVKRLMITCQKVARGLTDTSVLSIAFTLGLCSVK